MENIFVAVLSIVVIGGAILSLIAPLLDAKGDEKDRESQGSSDWDIYVFAPLPDITRQEADYISSMFGGGAVTVYVPRGMDPGPHFVATGRYESVPNWYIRPTDQGSWRSRFPNDTRTHR